MREEETGEVKFVSTNILTFLYIKNRMNQSERNGTTFHSFQEKISVSISLSKFPVMDKK